MKRYSMSLIIREIQMKTTMKYHLLSERLSSINQQTRSAGEDVDKRECFCFVVGMQIGAPTLESSMEIPQEIENGAF